MAWSMPLPSPLSLHPIIPHIDINHPITPGTSVSDMSSPARRADLPDVVLGVAEAQAPSMSMASEQQQQDLQNHLETTAHAPPLSPPSYQDSMTRTLDDAMREPSRVLPPVVELNSLPQELSRTETDFGETPSLKEDLWLSTADGRYGSPTIPIRVGRAPKAAETFYVHKHILLKAEYFRRMLCGEFSESTSQSIDLPDEDPAIFHFVVAYLYEGRFVPIRPAAAALDANEQAKNHGPASTQDMMEDSDSDASVASLLSASTVRPRRRRREHLLNQKHPDRHRPNCNCPQCVATPGPPCWRCRAPPITLPLEPMPIQPVPLPTHVYAPERHTHRSRRERYDVNGRRRRLHRLRPGPIAMPESDTDEPQPSVGLNPGRAAAAAVPISYDLDNNEHIRGRQDVHTWLLVYELTINVYVAANKFLLDSFKRDIARVCIDMLETAGGDAALPQVLRLCKKLYIGLSEHDPLLRMVFARVGFLQPLLWQRAPAETGKFLISCPEVAALLLREAMVRSEEFNGRTLPSMERGPRPVQPRNPGMGSGIGGPMPPTLWGPPGVYTGSRAPGYHDRGWDNY